VVNLETSPQLRYVGALLGKPAHDVTAASVPPEALSEPKATALYQAILGAASKRSEPTPVEVITELQERGRLDTAGGADGVLILGAMWANEPLDAVRREVLREASRRAAQEAGTRLAAMASLGRMQDAVGALQEALQAVQRFDGADNEEPLLHAADHLARLTERLGKLRRGEMLPLATAELGPLSRPIGQLRPGTLVVIGGYSHAGKSFLMQFLEAQYHRAAYPTLRLSLEDADSVTEARLLAEVGGFDLSSPYPGPYEATKAQEHLNAGLTGSATSRSVPRLIVTPESKDLLHLLRTMRRAVNEHAVKAVFVDYAQEIAVPGADDTRDRIAKAVSALKLEAIRLGVTVFLGSQLRKPPAQFKNYEPTPNDLKDASELHHAAEVLILCFKRARKEQNRVSQDRVGKVFKDKLTGSYPEFFMRSGVGGVVDALIPITPTRREEFSDAAE
jgi:replicative DNA helicase